METTTTISKLDIVSACFSSEIPPFDQGFVP